MPQVGLVAMGDFFYHFTALGIYTLLASTIAKPLSAVSSSLPRKLGYKVMRTVEGWRFGSGLDYYDHE